jgi:hypothetical protein
MDLSFALQTLKQLSVPASQVKDTCAVLYLARDDFILPAAMAAQAGVCSPSPRARKLNHLGDAPLEEARRQAFHLPLGKQFGVDAGIVWEWHGF